MNMFRTIIAINFLAAVSAWATTTTQPMLIGGTPGTYTVNTGSSDKKADFFRISSMDAEAQTNALRLVVKLLDKEGSAYVTTQEIDGHEVIGIAVSARPAMLESIGGMIEKINTGKVKTFGPGIDALHYRPRYKSAQYMLEIANQEITNSGYAYANCESNILTVVDDPGFFPYIQGILETHDCPSPKASIVVQIVELRKGTGSQIGVYWEAWKKALPESASLRMTGGRSPLPGNDMQLSTFDALIENMSPQAVGMFLNYLEEKGVARIENRTTLDVINGQVANFRSGRTVPYSLAAIAGRPSAELEAFEGVAIDVKSLLCADLARLTLDATASSIVGWTANGQPIVSSSKVTIATGGKYGENKVRTVTGLKMVRTVTDRNGVPVLGRIPGLRYFFSKEEKREEESDVNILLTIK